MQRSWPGRAGHESQRRKDLDTCRVRAVGLASIPIVDATALIVFRQKPDAVRVGTIDCSVVLPPNETTSEVPGDLTTGKLRGDKRPVFRQFLLSSSVLIHSSSGIFGSIFSGEISVSSSSPMLQKRPVSAFIAGIMRTLPCTLQKRKRDAKLGLSQNAHW
jgi:hypothetical protein